MRILAFLSFIGKLVSIAAWMKLGSVIFKYCFNLFSCFSCFLFCMEAIIYYISKFSFKINDVALNFGFAKYISFDIPEFLSELWGEFGHNFSRINLRVSLMLDKTSTILNKHTAIIIVGIKLSFMFPTLLLN